MQYYANAANAAAMNAAAMNAAVAEQQGQQVNEKFEPLINYYSLILSSFIIRNHLKAKNKYRFPTLFTGVTFLKNFKLRIPKLAS